MAIDDERSLPAKEGRQLSTAQVAEALGVGVSTVKRWVDDGILPAFRTAGGHRKLHLSDVLRLANEGRIPQADLTKLDPTFRQEPPSNLAKQAQQLASALVAGDPSRVRELIHTPYLAGIAIESIADQIISPAMKLVGHRWESQTIDVMHEHRATQLCLAALIELKVLLEPHAHAGGPVAVGGSPEGDPYLLADLLVQMVLLDCGWRAVNLGPNTPFASFEVALTELKPRLVWVSANFLADRGAFVQGYRRFYRAAELQRIPVALGGQAIDSALQESLPYTTFGKGLTQLAAFARSLHLQAETPKRGRPPGT